MQSLSRTVASRMLSYTKLARSPSLFRTFSGLEVSEFDSLYEKVESRYDEFEERRLSRPDRKKEVGEAGRRFKLGLDDRLLMLRQIRIRFKELKHQPKRQ